MLEVAAGMGRVQKQEQGVGKLPVLPICFCVHFDATPLSEVDDDVPSHGAQAFGLLSEIVVPIKMPLERVTLGDLLAEFMVRASARYPGVSQRSVDAFFFSADGSSVPSTEHIGREPLLRLDLSANAGDTLDCFFPHPVANGLSVYTVFAHWSSSTHAAAESDCIAAIHLKMKQRGAVGQEGDEWEKRRLLVSEEVTPMPGLLRSENCRRTSIVSCETEQKTNFHSPNPKVTSRAIAMIASANAKENAKRARRMLEGEERTAREAVVADECSARSTILEVEREGRRRTVTLLRLMDNCDDTVAWCGISPSDSFAIPRHYPVDTVPLAVFPSREYKAELMQRMEETVWLSHVFSKTPAVGSAATLARQKRLGGGKKVDDENESEMCVTASPGSDCAEGGGGSGDSDTVPLDSCKAVEDLIEHYYDLRRDLLLWERKTFRAITAEMSLILETQRQLDEEIAQTAILDELGTAAVFDFDSYSLHYEQHPICKEWGDKWRFQRNLITGTHATDTKSAVQMVEPTPNSPQKTEAQQGYEEAADATSGMMVPLAPSQPYVLLSPRSLLAEDEKFRLALEESKARATAALETIALIDKHWGEPTSFKLAKHRVSLAEKDERNAVLKREKTEWSEIVSRARQERCGLELNAILTHNRLIAPVVTTEEECRATVVQQHERQMSLFFSLYRRGFERLEMSSPQTL